MGYEREPSARSKAMALIKSRDKMEQEMQALILALTGPDGPGTSGSLVDSEGFPRADIDIPAVVQQRRSLNCLRTDHKEITGKIEKLLHEALAAQPEGDVVGEPGSAGGSSAEPPTDTRYTVPQSAAQPVQDAAATTAPQRQARPPPRLRPSFALVDLVSDGSPAKDAGLLVDDKIISFGAVSLRTLGNPEAAMRALPGLLREHENRDVNVSVSRAVDNGNGAREMKDLTLTPRRWRGQGLLGCHIVVTPVQEDEFVPQVATAVANRAQNMFSS